jgi:hypothetical protein
LQVSDARSFFEKMHNLLVWADPVLSGVFCVCFLLMALMFSLMLLVLHPPQFVFLCGLSFFTPPDIQDFVIEYGVLQTTKLQGWLIGDGKAKRARRTVAYQTSGLPDASMDTSVLVRMKSVLSFMLCPHPPAPLS